MTKTEEAEEEGQKGDRDYNEIVGKIGRYCHVPVDELHIDHAYQRDPGSEYRIEAMARDFDWAAFGAISVMIRDDGSMWVVDGQQRLLAAKKRGIKKVPVVWHNSEALGHEAHTFYKINTMRGAVSSLKKFNSRLLAGLSPEVEIAAWMAENSFVFERKDGKPVTLVGFPGLVVKHWKQNYVACREALLVQREIIKGESMDNNLQRGLYGLIACGVQPRPYIQKFIILGGKANMLNKIRARAIEISARGITEKVASSALLDIINRGRRTRKLDMVR